MRCYTISSLTRNRQQEVGKAAEHHCLLSSFHPSAGSRCIPAVFPRQLFPTSFPHLIIPPDMPVVAVKRKKAAIRPKIHVKGAITSSDPEEDSGVRKVKRDVDGGSGDDKRPRASTTRTYDSSDDDDGEDSDAMEQEEEDGTGKKVKSKKERQEERMASKGKQKEKAEERDARTVFVGNLPSACQPRELRKHFIQCGLIESVRLRGIIPSDPKLPKKAAAIKKSIHETCKSIFGYVVFRDPDSVVKALGLSTTKIGDNYISVQRVGNTTFENDVTVFIGNLPLKVQENAVREFFDECGHIQGIRLIRDSTTGIGKGFGFVSFGTRDGVILALEKNGADFEGREMRVKKAGKETEKREKRARKVDSKNARRRLRDSDSKGGKKSQSPADTNEDPDGGDEAEEGGGEEPVHRKKQKVRKTDTRIMFSGERMGKSVTKKKKKKQKLLKGRQSAGKKQAIARLLTA